MHTENFYILQSSEFIISEISEVMVYSSWDFNRERSRVKFLEKNNWCKWMILTKAQLWIKKNQREWCIIETICKRLPLVTAGFEVNQPQSRTTKGFFHLDKTGTGNQPPDLSRLEACFLSPSPANQSSFQWNF